MHLKGAVRSSWGGVGWGGWGKNVLALAYSILYTFVGPTSYTWGGVGLKWVGAVMFVHLRSIYQLVDATSMLVVPKVPTMTLEILNGHECTAFIAPSFTHETMWIPLAKIRS